MNFVPSARKSRFTNQKPERLRRGQIENCGEIQYKIYFYISLRSQDLYQQLSQVVNIDLGLGITQNDLIHAGENVLNF